jgi:hypothetical protein
VDYFVIDAITMAQPPKRKSSSTVVSNHTTKKPKVSNGARDLPKKPKEKVPRQGKFDDESSFDGFTSDEDNVPTNVPRLVDRTAVKSDVNSVGGTQSNESQGQDIFQALAYPGSF